jgi:hypothetical protein
LESRSTEYDIVTVQQISPVTRGENYVGADPTCEPGCQFLSNRLQSVPLLTDSQSPLDGRGSREPSDQDAPDLAAPIAPPTSTSTINQQQTTESGHIQDPPQLGYGHLPTTNTSFYQCDDFDPDLWMVFADEDSHFNVMEPYPAE